MRTPQPFVHVTTVHQRRDVRIFHKEAQSLRALGQRVILVVADGMGDETDAPDGVSFIDIGPFRGRLARAVLGNWRAMRTALRIDPEIVHFHDPELIPMGLLLKLLGRKVVYDVHEDLPRQIMNKHWIAPPLRFAVSRAVSAVERIAKWSFDAFVVATPYIGTNFPPGSTAVVQNFPIPSEMISPQQTTYASRPQSFAYVGGLSEARGAREMVAAVALLTDRPDARLHIAGSISPSALETELKRRPAWSRVVFHGQVGRPAVAQLLGSARAGMVVFGPAPNHLEAQPNKLFEYMAAGLPVIASDFPLWREIVAKAQCGLLVDPRDPAAIADAMRWILDHPEDAQAMGTAGQHAVATTYSWQSEAEKLLKLYRTLQSTP
ncbi:glycosyltransferase family 4 protein [uncultured Hyphomicrobium sp.]|uniref:glycosyltransferase family 4 protein n=1 Tax=uncultured Hyphomicrobium sp. TaxID=194373 RepID=UPI0025D393B0|nr:glycosyltransferase family 4 protein [uncultured Hyphomicrobium sp.]